MSKANFTADGLPIGANDRNMTYLYGVSDFWSSVFEDSDKINLFYEASSQQLSEIYSHFLQLCSTISLEDIQVYSEKQLKLVLLSESDAVVGKVNTYSLSNEVISARHIANRPLLPTLYLEDGVHFSISDSANEISFNSSLSTLGFPARITSTGDKQYALWFVDANIDEKFIYKYFGKILVPGEPEHSTESYKNFIYGLHYLFINGPDLANMKKGLNIALGIPLARDVETVLETRKYLNTDQYVVITDSNSYLIPYGLTPTVSTGDVLAPTDELAEWIEVKDYINDGEWWINLQIPPSVMPYIPPGEPDRYAKAGSYADYLMRNYLKKHTFLVNVKTIDFKNLQTFEQLFDIIRDAKPSYTTPLYIWTVPTADDTITLDDSSLTQGWIQNKCDNLSFPINKMIRKNVRYATLYTAGTSLQLQGNTISWGVGWESVKSDIPLASGTWYWEITNENRYTADFNKWDNIPVFTMQIGVGGPDTFTTGSFGEQVGLNGASWYFYTPNYGYSKVDSLAYTTMGGVGAFSLLFKNGSMVGSGYGINPKPTDVIGVLFNADTRQLSFYVNGVSCGVAHTLPVGTYYPMISSFDDRIKTTVNFGEREFSYPPTDPTVNQGVYSFSYGRQYAEFSSDRYPVITVSENTITGTISYLVSARGSYGGVVANSNIGKATGVYWTEYSFTTADLSGYYGFGIGVCQADYPMSEALGLHPNSFMYLCVNSSSIPGGPLYGFGGYEGSFLLNNNVWMNFPSPDIRASRPGDRIGLLFEASSGNFTIYKNGVNTGIMGTVGPGVYYPAITLYDKTTVTYNTGATPFTYAPPGGVVPGWFGGDGQYDNLARGCPQFIRCNTSWKIYGQLGNDLAVNGAVRSYENGIVTGYIGSDNQYQNGKALQTNEWISSVMYRDSETFGKPRSMMAFNRGTTSTNLGVQTFTKGSGLMRKVLLHVTTQAELSARMGTVGQQIPPLSTWEWTMFETQRTVGELINAQAIDTSRVTSYYPYLISNFSTIFNRVGMPYLGNFTPRPIGYETYTPPISEVLEGDFIWCIRIYENTIGVFWVTSNLTASAPNVRGVKVTDGLTLGMRNIPLRRGDGMYSPYYNIRGGGTNSIQNSLAIDAQPIDASIDSGSKIDVYYADIPNPTPVSINRNGVVFNISKEFS